MTFRARLWAFTITLLALVTWLALNWPHQGLWYDEALTTWLASGSWNNLINWCTRIDIQVPLHYIVLRGLMTVGGDTEFTLHLLSAFCALLAVAGVLALAQRLLGPSPAIITVALLAFTPSFLWIAYEVRAYALALALFAWASVILMTLIEPGKKSRRWTVAYSALYCVLSLAMLYTHYTGIAALAAHGVIVVWTAWQRRPNSAALLKRMAACAVVIGVGFAPWLPVLISRGATDRSFYPGAITPEQTLGVIFGFKWLARDDFRWLTPDQTISPLAPLVAAGLILMIGGVALWIDAIRRSPPNPRPVSPTQAEGQGSRPDTRSVLGNNIRNSREAVWRPLVYGLSTALLPILMIAVVVYFRPKLAGRYAWPAWVGIDLLLTCGLMALAARLPRRFAGRRLSAAGLVGLLIFVVFPWATGQSGHPPNSDFRGAFAYINAHWHASDLVILRDGTLFPVAAYYHSPHSIGLPDSLITDTSYVLHADEAASVLDAQKSSIHGIWLLAWQGDVMDPENITAALLETVGKDQPVRDSFGDVSLDYFALTHPLSAIQPPQVNADPLVTTPDGLTLRAVSLVTTGPLHPGDSIVAHTWWRRDGLGDGVTRVSIRLVGANGKTYGQQDQPPAGWYYLSNHWPQNTPILGRYAMALPPDVPDSITMKLVVYSAANVMTPVEVTVGTVQIAR